jgi:hypothetical protein
VAAGQLLTAVTPRRPATRAIDVTVIRTINGTMSLPRRRPRPVTRPLQTFSPRTGIPADNKEIAMKQGFVWFQNSSDNGKAASGLTPRRARPILSPYVKRCIV